LQPASWTAPAACALHASNSGAPLDTGIGRARCPRRGPGTLRAIAASQVEEPIMTDIIYIAATGTFFVVAWLYARACDGL
jgi:hypothetical protein